MLSAYLAAKEAKEAIKEAEKAVKQAEKAAKKAEKYAEKAKKYAEKADKYEDGEKAEKAALKAKAVASEAAEARKIAEEASEAAEAARKAADEADKIAQAADAREKQAEKRRDDDRHDDDDEDEDDGPDNDVEDLGDEDDEPHKDAEGIRPDRGGDDHGPAGPVPHAPIADKVASDRATVLNEAPVIEEDHFALDPLDGTAHAKLYAWDMDGDTFEFSIVDDPSGLFSIDPESGALWLTNANSIYAAAADHFEERAEIVRQKHKEANGNAYGHEKKHKGNDHGNGRDGVEDGASPADETTAEEMPLNLDPLTYAGNSYIVTVMVEDEHGKSSTADQTIDILGLLLNLRTIGDATLRVRETGPAIRMSGYCRPRGRWTQAIKKIRNICLVI